VGCGIIICVLAGAGGDVKLDGQYTVNMARVYKEGNDQVDALLLHTGERWSECNTTRCIVGFQSGR
jgi:hypothetical protein